MPNYQRARAGRTFFFTVVTYQRRRFLCEERCRSVLREAINSTRNKYPFLVDAWVLLPDHMHCIWTLPPNESDYSVRWSTIKRRFTQKIGNELIVPGLTASRQKRRESATWQRRFWEHMIQSDRDYEAHMDYIHYNPVKHGLVDQPLAWPFSTLRRMVEEGVYPPDWGSSEVELPDGVGKE